MVAGVVAAGFPSGLFVGALWSAGLIGLAAVAWLAAGILGLAARQFDVFLVLPPILLAGALVAAWLDLPLQIRFAATRPAFEKAVAARGEAGSVACPARIGSYRVFRCVTDRTITRFYTDGGFLNPVGFGYAPTGVPAPSGGDGSVSYRPPSGSWYTFTEQW